MDSPGSPDKAQKADRDRIVEPRTLRGFRDLLPAVAADRSRLLAVVEGVFESYGVRPIVTPALEYADILRGKGGDEQDHQMFTFVDQGGREVGMRFDLTVPLARFVAQHHGDLVFPFRCYQIGTVWRGERPQKGRFREFIQCDTDIIGATDCAADVEILSLLHAAMRATDLGTFTFRLNHRRILAGFLHQLGIAALTTPVLRALDKHDKIGRDGVARELAELGLDSSRCDQVLALAQRGDESNDSNDQTVERLRRLTAGSDEAAAGIDELAGTVSMLVDAGVPTGCLRIDPSISRGLDYYTGVVFETEYGSAPEIGSVCSGGRYDNLTLAYSKHRLPGVGGSIGLDRLVAAAFDAGVLPGAGGRRVIVVAFDSPESRAAAVHLTAAVRALRGDDVVELLAQPDNAGKQLRYADRRGAHVLVSIDTAAGDTFVRNLRTKHNVRATIADVPGTLVDPAFGV